MADLQFKSTTAPVYGINNIAYGGMDSLGSGSRYGAYFYGLTIPNVFVYRRQEDIFADQVRLRIWDMPEATYDSAFTGIAAGQTLTFYHNLNGLLADYLVDLQYFNTAGGIFYQVHQFAYGGLDLGAADLNHNKRMGAAWHTLTSNYISVTRGAEDNTLNTVRVRIWLVSRPAFHSGWVGMALNSPQPISHFLGHTPEDYFVNVMFNGSTLVNNQYYGTNYLGAYGEDPENSYVGAYWCDLTNNRITLFRANQDTSAQYIQARIWLIHQQVFIPLIKR